MGSIDIWEGAEMSGNRNWTIIWTRPKIWKIKEDLFSEKQTYIHDVKKLSYAKLRDNAQNYFFQRRIIRKATCVSSALLKDPWLMLGKCKGTWRLKDGISNYFWPRMEHRVSSVDIRSHEWTSIDHQNRVRVSLRLVEWHHYSRKLPRGIRQSLCECIKCIIFRCRLRYVAEWTSTTMDYIRRNLLVGFHLHRQRSRWWSYDL